jgi:hypothetical protein
MVAVVSYHRVPSAPNVACLRHLTSRAFGTQHSRAFGTEHSRAFGTQHSRAFGTVVLFPARWPPRACGLLRDQDCG